MYTAENISAVRYSAQASRRSKRTPPAGPRPFSSPLAGKLSIKQQNQQPQQADALAERGSQAKALPQQRQQKKYTARPTENAAGYPENQPNTLHILLSFPSRFFINPLVVPIIHQGEAPAQPEKACRGKSQHAFLENSVSDQINSRASHRRYGESHEPCGRRALPGTPRSTFQNRIQMALAKRHALILVIQGLGAQLLDVVEAVIGGALNGLAAAVDTAPGQHMTSIN